MTYLVAGGAEVDAGKTTFSVGLVEYLDTTGFKPRAGNDFWYHHGDYRHAIEEGRMYGKDARRLAETSAADVAPEEINPVHRFWRPAPRGDGFIGEADRHFVLDRVGEGFVVNEGGDLPERARSALPLEGAPRVSTVEELNEQIRKRHLPHLEALGRRISGVEDAVVESYGDVARPLQDLDPVRVAVVEPERVRIYDGERYANACEVATGSPMEGRLEEVVGSVVDLVDPIESRRLPPLTDEERSDPARVAGAYANVYDALIA